MASSSRSSAPPNTAMAEAQNIHTGPSQQSLQCPRCSSSNTKFCYYNNYSLSQPRHFCKACKRYWTRGGTLRNVPVGGGCRRNKRLKRPQSSSSRGVDGAAAVTTSVSGLPNTKVNSSSPPLNRAVSNPLIYGGLHASNNLLEPLHSPFSGLGSTRVSDENPGFEFQPQVNGLGLRFSSGLVNGPPFSWSSSPFSTSVFGSSADYGASSTMASLLASTFQQQKLGANSSFHSMISEPANGESGFHHGHGVTGTKDVKVEGENGLSFLNPNPIDQLMNSMDPSSLLWSTANLGSWPDSSNSNMGSSVSSLI